MLRKNLFLTFHPSCHLYPQDKLNFLKYQNMEAFVADIRLIVRNAHEYNGELSTVGHEATEMMGALQVSF